MVTLVTWKISQLPLPESVPDTLGTIEMKFHIRPGKPLNSPKWKLFTQTSAKRPVMLPALFKVTVRPPGLFYPLQILSNVEKFYSHSISFFLSLGFRRKTEFAHPQDVQNLGMGIRGPNVFLLFCIPNRWAAILLLMDLLFQQGNTSQSLEGIGTEVVFIILDEPRWMKMNLPFCIQSDCSQPQPLKQTSSKGDAKIHLLPQCCSTRPLAAQTPSCRRATVVSAGTSALPCEIQLSSQIFLISSHVTGHSKGLSGCSGRNEQGFSRHSISSHTPTPIHCLFLGPKAEMLQRGPVPSLPYVGKKW